MAKNKASKYVDQLEEMVARAIDIIDEARPAIEAGCPSNARRFPIDERIRLLKHHAQQMGLRSGKAD